MTDQGLKDAIRRGVMLGLGLGPDLAGFGDESGYDAGILLDNIVEQVEQHMEEES